MVKVKSFFKRFYMVLILLFLYAPIMVLIAFSFNSSRTMAKWSGFTLDWYAQLFKDSIIMDSLWVTISVAVLSSVIAVIIGVLAAIGIQNCRKGVRSLMVNVTYIPMINADIVTGISLLLLFIFMHIPRGYTTMLIAHIAFNIPYVILSVLPKLRSMDTSLYEAALDMGAKPSYAIRKVVLPQLMPGILTGFILAFTMSFDDFVISFFTTQGLTQNLSIYVYSMAKVGINPKINALSAVMFVVMITLLLIINARSNILDKRKKERVR